MGRAPVGAGSCAFTRGSSDPRPRARWGSCDPSGTLRFSWRIIQAPPALVDYVVVHELVHLHHRGHTPRFWAALGRVIPDYEPLRALLRDLGPALVW